uniref:uncharacterized protein LOC105352071 isoform X1 n=1 Tax=Fragaria vesca subsp. vesca TaxID=101020 RepID=UPI0005CA3A5C|nr:PREDICTED: uncharacterized protein LOC105352071 isoform X1 [Fragaria vesca subsp. vesca]
MRIEEVRLNKAMEAWCCRVEMKEREVITGTIRILIERKQLIKAVPFICNFKQNDEFPLVPLLREYVQKKSCTEIFSKDISHDEKEKVVDDQIAGLKSSDSVHLKIPASSRSTHQLILRGKFKGLGSYRRPKPGEISIVQC